MYQVYKEIEGKTVWDSEFELQEWAEVRVRTLRTIGIKAWIE